MQRFINKHILFEKMNLFNEKFINSINMKNLKLFYLLIFSISLLATSACSDDDDNSVKVYVEKNDYINNKVISERINSLETSIPYGLSTLKISGGDGKYTAKSSDENILVTSISENYLHMTLYKAGTAQVTISDGNNEILIVPITISEGKRYIKIIESLVDIVVETDEDSETHKDEIELIKKEIIKNLLPADAQFELSINSISDDLIKRNGTYTLFPKPTTTNESVKGTFTDEYIPADKSGREIYYQQYSFVSGSSKRSYTIGKYDIQPETLRSSPPVHIFYWAEDFTDVYKTLYPDLKINKAVALQKIYIDTTKIN